MTFGIINTLIAQYESTCDGNFKRLLRENILRVKEGYLFSLIYSEKLNEKEIEKECLRSLK
ncbi:MAG: hypothetical protein ACOC22_00500 [bacterium]